MPFGCLVAEQIGDEMAPTDAHARTEVVSRHASTALWNAQEHDKIFMLPLLKLMGSPWRYFRGRTLAKILGVLGAIIGVILILTFVPYELTIEGKGSLLPEGRQISYAPVAGIVMDVPVEHGMHVKKGDTLARVDSRDLEKERKKLFADMQAAQTQASYLSIQAHKASSTGNEEEYNQVQGQMAEANEKLEMMAKAYADLFGGQRNAGCGLSAVLAESSGNTPYLSIAFSICALSFFASALGSTAPSVGSSARAASVPAIVNNSHASHARIIRSLRRVLMGTFHYHFDFRPVPDR